MPAKDVLAIDFGTTNSYYCKCSGESLLPVGVDFGDGRDGLASAILYRKGKVPLIGNRALTEYGEATKKERADYDFRTYFKPDIAFSETAKNDAVNFLAAVLSESKGQRLDLNPLDRQVLFGIPSESDDAYRRAIIEIAEKAGYGKVQTMHEPKGALLFHLYRRDFPVQEAMKGLLAVDFGGGTCDFAFLYNGKIKKSWGDMHLGGRLFDDLFYQWLLETNPEAEKLIKESRSEYFVLTHVCREIKEFFSQTMSRDRTEEVVKAIRGYGRLVMTWESFLSKAGNYVMSKTLKQHFIDIGQDLNKFPGNDLPVDLLEYFRSCMMDGLRQAQIEKSDIKFIILAGGSSLWSFVPEILEQEFDVSSNQIKRSDRPYAAIASGLSMWPAQKANFKLVQNKLKNEFPDIYEHVQSSIDESCNSIASQIAKEISSELFDKRLNPVFQEFKLNGGKIASLKKQIASAALDFESELKGIVENNIYRLKQGLPAKICDLVKNWFKENNLVCPVESITIDGDDDKVKVPSILIDDWADNITKPIMTVSSGIVAILSAEIAGGSGLALIASGPLGWIIGLMVGAAVAWVAINKGVDKARKMAENIDIPGFVLKTTLTDRKLKKVRNDIQSDIKKSVLKNLGNIKEDIRNSITEKIKREINALSEIQNF